MKIAIITRYRISKRKNGGTSIVLEQLNRVNNKEETEKYYQEVYLKEMENI